MDFFLTLYKGARNQKIEPSSVFHCNSSLFRLLAFACFIQATSITNATTTQTHARIVLYCITISSPQHFQFASISYNMIETLIEFESSFLRPQLCAANRPFPGTDCSDNDTSAANADSHCTVANAVYYDLCDLILSMNVGIECSVETIGLDTYYNKTSHDNDGDRIQSESPLGIDAKNALSFRHGETKIMSLAYPIPIHSQGDLPMMELYLGDCAWIDIPRDGDMNGGEEAKGRDKRMNALRNLAHIESTSDHWRLGRDSFIPLDTRATADPDSDPDVDEQRRTFVLKEAIKADFKIAMSHDIQDYADSLHFRDDANASPRHEMNVRFEPYPAHMHAHTHASTRRIDTFSLTWSEALQSIQHDPVLCVLLGLLAIVTVVFFDVVIFLMGDPRPKPGSCPFLFGVVRTCLMGMWMGISLYMRVGRRSFVCMGLVLLGSIISWKNICWRLFKSFASWNKVCWRLFLVKIKVKAWIGFVYYSLCKVWLVPRALVISIGAGAVWVQEAVLACLVSVANVFLKVLQFPSRLLLRLRLRSSPSLDDDKGNELQQVHNAECNNAECEMNMKNIMTPPHQKKSPSCPTVCPVTAYKPRTAESQVSVTNLLLPFVSPDGSESEAEVSPSTRRFSETRTLLFDTEATLMEGTDTEMAMEMQPRVVSPRNAQFKNDRNIRDRQLAIYEDLLFASVTDEIDQSFTHEGGTDLFPSVNVDGLDSGSVEGSLGDDDDMNGVEGIQSHVNIAEGVEDILNHELAVVNIDVCDNVDASSTGLVMTAQCKLHRDDVNADTHGGVDNLSQSPLISPDMSNHSNGVSEDDVFVVYEDQKCVDEAKSIQGCEGVESRVNTSGADMPNDELQSYPVANTDSCNNVEIASVGLTMTEQEELPQEDVNAKGQNEIEHSQTPSKSLDMSCCSSAVSEDNGIDDAKNIQESGDAESHEEISEGVGDVPNDDELECSPVINTNVEAMTKEEKLPRNESNVESRHGVDTDLQTTFKNCDSNAGEHNECVDHAKSIQDDEALVDIENDNPEASCISIAVIDNSSKAPSSVHKYLENSEILELEQDSDLFEEQAGKISTDCNFSEECGVPVHEEEVQYKNITDDVPLPDTYCTAVRGFEDNMSNCNKDNDDTEQSCNGDDHATLPLSTYCVETGGEWHSDVLSDKSGDNKDATNLTAQSSETERVMCIPVEARMPESTLARSRVMYNNVYNPRTEKSVGVADCVSTEYLAVDPIASFTSMPVMHKSEQQATDHLDEVVDTAIILPDTGGEFVADPLEESQTFSTPDVDEKYNDVATEGPDSGNSQSSCNKLHFKKYVSSSARAPQDKDPLDLQSVRAELFAKLKTRANFVHQETISSRFASQQALGLLRHTKPNKLRTPDAFIVKNENANTSPNLPPRQRSVTNNISQLVAKWSNDGETNHSEAPEAVHFSGKKVRKKVISPFHHKDKQKIPSKPKRMEPFSGVEMGSSESNTKGRNAAASDTELLFLDEMLG